MSLSLGVLNAFDTSLRQSLIPVMVGGRDDLPNALALATRQSVRGSLNLAIFCVVLAALALLVFPLSADLAIALSALAALGFGISGANVGANVGINTVMQTIAPDRLRGRVVSFFSSVRFGLDAIGGLIAGSIAALAGAPATLLGESAILVAAAAWLLLRAGRLRQSIKNP